MNKIIKYKLVAVDQDGIEYSVEDNDYTTLYNRAMKLKSQGLEVKIYKITQIF